ncbi:MAG: hypothetical protein ABW174_08825, partial [Flavitalea sp.]
MKKLLLLNSVLLCVVFCRAQKWTIFQNELPSLSVSSLAVDQSGAVYAATASGLTKFQNDNWTVVSIQGNTGRSTYRVWTFAGKLWVSLSKGSLMSYHQNSWTNHDPAPTEYTTVGIGVDSRDSLFRLDESGAISVKRTDGWARVSTAVSAMNLFVDKQDNVWGLGTYGGLTRYKDGQIKGWPYDKFGNPNAINATAIYDMVQDSTGMYWLATRNGLMKFDGSIFQTYLPSNSGICSALLSTIEIDKNGVLWIGTQDKGISRFDGTNWKTYDTINSMIGSNTVTDIVADNANHIWVAHGSGPFAPVPSGHGISVLDENAVGPPPPVVPLPPVAPGNLLLTQIAGEVKLTWSDNSQNESRFIVERSTFDSTHFLILDSVAANTITYSDKTIKPGNVYYYRVRANNTAGTSAYTFLVSARVDDGRPPASFREVTKGNLINSKFATGTYWSDVDGNNTPDLFVGEYSKMFLNSDGRFIQTADDFGNLSAVAFADYDRDGDDDMFVGSS